MTRNKPCTLVAADGSAYDLLAIDSGRLSRGPLPRWIPLIRTDFSDMALAFVPDGKQSEGLDEASVRGGPLTDSLMTEPREGMRLLRTSSCVLSASVYKSLFPVTKDPLKADAVLIGSMPRARRLDSISLFHVPGTRTLLALHESPDSAGCPQISAGMTLEELIRDRDRETDVELAKYGSAKCVAKGRLYTFPHENADFASLFGERLFPSLKGIVLEEDLALFLSRRSGTSLSTGKFSELIALLSSFDNDNVSLGMRAASAMPWQECPGCFKWLLHTTRFRWMPLHRNGDLFDLMARKLGMYPGRSQPSALGRISEKEFEEFPDIVSSVVMKELADRVSELNTLLSPSRLEVSLEKEAVTVKRISAKEIRLKVNRTD